MTRAYSAEISSVALSPVFHSIEKTGYISVYSVPQFIFGLVAMGGSLEASRCLSFVQQFVSFLASVFALSPSRVDEFLGKGPPFCR